MEREVVSDDVSFSLAYVFPFEGMERPVNSICMSVSFGGTYVRMDPPLMAAVVNKDNVGSSGRPNSCDNMNLSIDTHGLSSNS
jgi:hypothetical protein